MNMPLRGLLLPVLLLASCAAPVAVSSSPPASTAPLATVAATTSAPTTKATAAPIFAATECTSATATTRQVVDRYFVELRPSPPWAASDVWGWDQWGIFLVTLLPTAIGASVLGAWVRRAALPARRVLV